MKILLVEMGRGKSIYGGLTKTLIKNIKDIESITPVRTELDAYQKLEEERYDLVIINQKNHNFSEEKISQVENNVAKKAKTYGVYTIGMATEEDTLTEVDELINKVDLFAKDIIRIIGERMNMGK